VVAIACVLFPDFTQLDLTGPFEIFHRIPDAEVQLVAATAEPVVSEGGLAIVPTITFAEMAGCNVLFVPGGPGVNAAMLDDELIAFLQRHGEHAQWVASACTGALLLGAAGLLAGHNATTHWASMQFLEAFGAWPKDRRVVRSDNRITGAGVTAGIDVGLTIAELLCDVDVSEQIRLAIEYRSDIPSTDDTRAAVAEKLRPRMAERARAVQQAARKLSS
jgi:cyclohexyl-isocyanide hydratase